MYIRRTYHRLQARYCLRRPTGHQNPNPCACGDRQCLCSSEYAVVGATSTAAALCSSVPLTSTLRDQTVRMERKQHQDRQRWGEQRFEAVQQIGWSKQSSYLSQCAHVLRSHCQLDDAHASTEIHQRCVCDGLCTGREHRLEIGGACEEGW